MPLHGRIHLVAAMFVLVFLAITLHVTLGVDARIGTLYPGFFISEQGFVGLKMLADPSVDLATHDVGFGDRLVAIEGVPYRGQATLRTQLESIGERRMIRYQMVRTDGEEYVLSARARRFTQDHFLTGALPMIAAGMIGLAAVLIVILAQPDLPETRIFCIAGWAALLELE